MTRGFPDSLSLKARRSAAERLGRQAEDQVAALLHRSGYKILAQRLKTAAGEIDLVAANARLLLFIEVKARASFTDASYALLPAQQTRLLRAAEAALASHPSWARPATRFDVALVAAGEVKLIEAARWQS